MATVIHFCDMRSGMGRARGAAPTAAVGDRFRLWQGRSGRRHVFTRIESDRDAVDLAEDLDGAVILVARHMAGDVVVAERVCLASDLPSVAPGRELWAHFLAQTDAERRAVTIDLSPNRVEPESEIRATSRAA